MNDTLCTTALLVLGSARMPEVCLYLKVCRCQACSVASPSALKLHTMSPYCLRDTSCLNARGLLSP
jgi:hypothetical protein